MALAFRLWSPAEEPVLCPFRWLVDLPCPLCGLTRAFAALARGEWAQAIALHALSPLLAIVLAAAVLRLSWAGRAVRASFAGLAAYGLLRIAEAVPGTL